MEVKEQRKTGALINARFFINGPHYYIVSQKLSGPQQPEDYLNSFSFKTYKYPEAKLYTDTFLRASVSTHAAPDIDKEMRSLIEQTMDATANNYNGYISYWPKPKNGLFRSDSTVEMVAVQVQEFPKYYYITYSVKFWQNKIETLTGKGDLFIAGMINSVNEKGFSGFNVSLRDTGNSRSSDKLLLIKDNFKYKISSNTDTVNGASEFNKMFLNSFRPQPNNEQKNIYESKLPIFFSDLFSKDSALSKKATQSVTNLNYGVPGIPLLMHAINRLSVSDHNYYETKKNMISELGFIRDSTSSILVSHLRSIYDKTADTSLFQNEVLKSLSGLKTKAAYVQLKELLLQEPSVLENNYDYNSIFSNLEDILKQSAILFLEVMQLATLDDYKEKVVGLLVELVDSGYVKVGIYDSYFPGIYIDAVVALKKQKIKDEKAVQEANKLPENEYQNPLRGYNHSATARELNNYSIILMPFYERNKNVRSFFNRTL